MKACVFTTIFEEFELFPHWLAYYRREFYMHDIFVVVHSAQDASVEALSKKYPFNVVVDGINETERLVADWERSNIYVRQMQKDLLKRYDWVLLAHADEFVVPNPDKYIGIYDYISHLRKPYVHCTAYEPIHIAGEGAIDWSRPLLVQRRWMRPDTAYNKPLLSRIPLEWKNGFHTVDDSVDLAAVGDPDLVLFHVQKIDMDTFKRRTPYRPEFCQKAENIIEIPSKFRHVF